MMPSTMTGKEIKALREKLGLTGDELAERLGVTGNTVRRWECGIRQAKGPAVTILEAMAKDFDQPVSASA